MNSRTLLLAIAAIGTAGVTAFMAKGWLEGQRARMSVAAIPTKVEAATQVLVANASLGAGAFVKPSDLRWQPWPEDGLAKTYVLKGKRKPADFTGAVVRRGVATGQPVTDEQLVKPGERGFLAAVLKPGMRAVSVPVTAASAIAGLVFPGDRVDMILSHRFENPSPSKADRKLRHVSETVLVNVRILALDQSTDDQNGKTKKAVPKTATLEVSPKQAEIVSVALNLGALSLSLRALGIEEGSKPATDETTRGRSVTRDSDVSRVLNAGTSNVRVVHVLRAGKTEISPIPGAR